MSAPLPEINLFENVLFISEVSDIVLGFSFFVFVLQKVCCLGISHLLTRELELQEIVRLSVGTHCTHKEHMCNCCICGSNVLNVIVQHLDFGSINMLLARVDVLFIRFGFPTIDSDCSNKMIMILHFYKNAFHYHPKQTSQKKLHAIHVHYYAFNMVESVTKI